MLSAFSFEGMLKFCGSLLHGTRGYGNRIGQHLGAENYLFFNAEDKFSTMHNLQLKSFCNKLRNKSLHKHGIIGHDKFLRLLFLVFYFVRAYIFVSIDSMLVLCIFISSPSLLFRFSDFFKL